MKSFLTRNWKILTPVGVVLAAIGAYLAFGIFGIHTLFIDDKVDEAGPVFASGATSDPEPEVEPDPEVADDEVVDTTPDPVETVDEPAGEAVVDEESAPEESATEEPATEEPAAEEPAEPVIEIVTLASGSFIGRSHPAEGTALVLNDGSEQRFLRFEDFSTDNGPDLNVYLSTAPPDAPEGDFDDDFVDLGTLKGNIGDQNYEIPVDVDLDRYQSVVIWCVRFGVAFGAAELM